MVLKFGMVISVENPTRPDLIALDQSLSIWIEKNIFCEWFEFLIGSNPVVVKVALPKFFLPQLSTDLSFEL